MKRVFGLFTLVLIMVGLVLVIAPASFADQSIDLGTGHVVARAVPSSQLNVPDPLGGETEHFNPTTGAGACCRFDNSCTGAHSFVAGDTVIFNAYWNEVASSSSMTFNLTEGVSPTSNPAQAIIFWDAPVGPYTGLTPGVTYTFCAGIYFDPVPQTQPLCNFFWGYRVDGSPIGVGVPTGDLDINC